MSQHLQRFAVRMLYDPRLVDAVYEGRSVEGLTDAQRALLTAGPRAAWGADRLRSSRTLQALLEEYPASAAVTGIAPLHRFFAAEEFHRCIQQRGRLVEAFGQWLVGLAGRIAQLELAIAQSRRGGVRLEGVLCRARGLVPVSLPEGTLADYQRIRGRLGAEPLKVLLLKGFQPIPLSPPAAQTEHWLIERGAAGGVQVGGGSAALNGLLAAAPARQEALEQAAVRLGAAPEEARGIIDDLLREGLLERT